MEEKIVIVLDGGKYTVIYDPNYSLLKCLRYDEEWRDLTGDNLVYHLVMEIVGLKEQISKEAMK
jgi:hypothetical protein